VPLLTGGHRQTLYAWARRRRFPRLQEPVERYFDVAPDARVLAHCHWQNAPASHPTIVLLHGLEGSSYAHYMCGIADKGWAAGWNVVPPTVLRDDAPLGPGSLQVFIEHDPERHYFVLMDDHQEELRTFAAFDVVVNNADRKAGHVIADADDRLWAVDHGLTFNVEPKLRTVIWAFAEEPLGREVRARLETLGATLAEDSGLGGELTKLLSREEADATLARVEDLLVEDRFPAPGSSRPLPWPLI
jgi:uncharacterized repeat protein (TIGR03843 family)